MSSLSGTEPHDICTDGPNNNEGNTEINVQLIMHSRECMWYIPVVRNHREYFHMTSRRPYWYSKTTKWWPCWLPKPFLWELNSFLMQTLSFVLINLHRCGTCGTWMKTLYSPLSVHLCLATTHDTVPILISVFPSTLFGLYVQSGMCGSVPKMCDILKTSRYPSFSLA